MLELQLDQLDYPLLSLLVFIPVLGSFVLLFIRNASTVRPIALTFSIIELLLCMPLLLNFDSTLHSIHSTGKLSKKIIPRIVHHTTGMLLYEIRHQAPVGL